MNESDDRPSCLKVKSSVGPEPNSSNSVDVSGWPGGVAAVGHQARVGVVSRSKYLGCTGMTVEVGFFHLRIQVVLGGLLWALIAIR